MMTRNLILFTLICALAPCVHAQTDYFRVLGGIPHLPVFSSTGDIASPAAGMLIYDMAYAAPMLYNGSDWVGLGSLSATNGGIATFLVLDRIPRLSVRFSTGVAPISGGMYYSSSDGAIKIHDGTAWLNLADLSSGTLSANGGFFGSLKEFIQLPILSSDPAPIGLTAGALYINSTEKTFKYYDGIAWQELTLVPAARVNGSSGGTLVFMSHNLGADTSLNPFVYVNNGGAVDNDIKGYLYQWGRPTDGHQSRSSGTTTDLSSSNAPGHGDFIINDNYPYSWTSFSWTNLWGTTKTANDPCPAGFRVPTRQEWNELFSNNTRTWTADGGVEIDADGDGSPELYLPAAGNRNYDGYIFGTSGGHYWSSSLSGNLAYNLYFDSGFSYLNMANTKEVGSGCSVRCIEGQ